MKYEMVVWAGLGAAAASGLIKLSYFSTHKFTPQASNFGSEMI